MVSKELTFLSPGLPLEDTYNSRKVLEGGERGSVIHVPPFSLSPQSVPIYVCK